MIELIKNKFFRLGFFCILFFSSQIVSAKSFGIGITGHWGMNIWGFGGKKIGVEKVDAEGNSTYMDADSKFYSGSTIGGGVYAEYFFGVEREEVFGLGFACKFNRRDIIACFDNEGITKVDNYYSSFYDRIEQDCIDLQLEVLLNMYRGEWVTFGMHLGGGGYYALLQSLSPHDIEPTRLQVEKTEEALSKYNLYALLGFHWNFLDRMMELRATTSVTFMDQVNKDVVNNALVESYGSAVSVGQFQISPIIELRINMWEVITA